jgi:hypothetical protein
VRLPALGVLRTLALATCLVLLPHAASGQAPRAFSIFLDCSDFYCDPDFYRTDIAFVDHVRDRTAADVHILVTHASTGGGGNTFALAFYGQRRFAGVSDTLAVTTPQGATEDERRQAISRTVKLGLARYLARTRDATRATLSLEAATDTAKATAVNDPWDAWVFRIGMNLNASRERDYKSDYVYGSLNGSRVTEQWKSNWRVYENYNGQQFTGGGDTTVSVRRDYAGAVQQVRSLGSHWAAGVRGSAGSSTFFNQHLFINAGPALEYNVYPYKESTRHVLSFLYSVGVRHFRYEDTTIYYRTRETLPYQSLVMNLAQKQKWGSLSLEVSGSHYLNDLGKSRLTFYPEADVRLIKGLSLNLFGNYTVMHDQIYLPKGTLTREEVLLRNAQAATSYSAFLYLGISYTFGSVFNNVVNPRFSSPSSEF